MKLNRKDALYAANIFNDYFSSFGRIDDYLRKVKLERMSNRPVSLPGMGPEADFLSDYSIHPEDMEFECREMPNHMFVDALEITTSHAVEVSVPGKAVKWVVYEKNTNKIVGFIRLGSPTINSKPRNEMLGKPLDTRNKDVMKRFNDSVIMGFIIVPVQPFGYNYLGGKLLAAICCSHLTKDTLDRKYGGPFCGFETTSLYGSTKSSSQYDGMKPFLRYKGVTMSDFAPLINDDNFRKLSSWFIEKNDGAPLVDPNASSRKLKTQTKMISIIKNSLKSTEPNEYKKFVECFSDAKNLTEKKRSYWSNYGFENAVEYLNMETDELRKAPNYDRYSLEGVVSWWRKLATKRWSSVSADGRLRPQLEVWNENPDIDIIR